MTNQYSTAANAEEADRLEQETPLISDDDEALPATEPPLEANEADVIEQSLQVPDDEDYPPDS